MFLNFFNIANKCNEIIEINVSNFLKSINAIIWYNILLSKKVCVHHFAFNDNTNIHYPNQNDILYSFISFLIFLFGYSLSIAKIIFIGIINVLKVLTYQF